MQIEQKLCSEINGLDGKMLISMLNSGKMRDNLEKDAIFYSLAKSMG